MQTQRKILFLTLILIIITGCTKIERNNTNYVNYVVSCLNNKSITNDVAIGYKYYLPRGVEKIKDYDYNQKFLVDNTYLYMYVDINSYYYKSKLKSDDKNSYYFQKVSYDGKNGYIKIIKEKDNQYLVKLIYNYAKMEFCCNEANLNKLITTSSIILNSITYNRVVIEKVLDESLASSREFTYEFKKPTDASNDFSQYLEEYVKDDDSKQEKLPDE